MYYQGLINKYRKYLPVSDTTPVVTLNEGNTPLIKADNLAKIADYLNCSVDELLSWDTITGISETEDIMLKHFRKLNAAQQEALIKLISIEK